MLFLVTDSSMYQIARIREVALCIPTVHFYYGILSRGVGTGPAGPVLAGPLNIMQA